MSNARNTVAKRELGERSRLVNSSKHRNTALLSSSVLEDPEETMLPDGEHENITEERDGETGDLSSSFCRLKFVFLSTCRSIRWQCYNDEANNRIRKQKSKPTQNMQKNSKYYDSCQINQKKRKENDAVLFLYVLASPAMCRSRKGWSYMDMVMPKLQVSTRERTKWK